MTHIKIGDSLFLVPDEQWEEWVRRGLIPPSAWVRSPVWTDGIWRLADTLEVYHLFIPSRAEVPRRPAPGLGDTIFPRRGLSMTEGLILLNLTVTCALFLIWRELYDMRLVWFLRFVRNFVGSGKGFFALLGPMFMHASPSHLFYNMIALLAAGSVTEYFYGKGRMLATYLMAGFGGAAMSLALRPMPAVSVGASGAIFGLYGLSILFLLRNFRRFDAVHRWKTFRVYLPIAVLAVFPSIAGERVDFYGHLGGLLTGCAIGLFLPPGARLAYVTERTQAPDPAAPATGDGAAAGPAAKGDPVKSDGVDS